MAAPIRTLTVDKEFAAEGRKLTTEEENFLYAGLVTDGCRDPIVVWAGHNDTILDGHNRYRLCRENNIPFDVIELSLPDRKACIEWIRKNQLGRRNLTEEEKSYLRGKRYEQDKKKVGRPAGKSAHDAHITTAKKLAIDFGVDHTTIRRDEKFAKAVDTVADTVGPEAKSEILSGDSKLTKKDVREIAAKPATEQPAAYRETKSKTDRKQIPSTTEKLIEQLNLLVTRVDRMAASHLGHNNQSKQVVACLKDCITKVKAMQRSWRNK